MVVVAHEKCMRWIRKNEWSEIKTPCGNCGFGHKEKKITDRFGHAEVFTTLVYLLHYYTI
jgi:ribosomal protein L37E